jgi:hypothetical protein
VLGHALTPYHLHLVNAVGMHTALEQTSALWSKPPSAPLSARSQGLHSVRCREIWERLRHWAPAPVWLRVVQLEQAMVMLPVARCSEGMTQFMPNA